MNRKGQYRALPGPLRETRLELKKHKVFETSFDGKAIFTDQFLHQKIDYIHYNPVQGKWNLAEDFTSYFHSSASFYENNSLHPKVVLIHYLDLNEQERTVQSAAGSSARDPA